MIFPKAKGRNARKALEMVKRKSKIATSSPLSRPSSLAREKLEGRLVGGRFADLANYSELFDRSNDGIFLVDIRNLEVLETNAAVQALLGSDHSPRGISFASLFDTPTGEMIHEWLRRSEKGKVPAPPLEMQSFQSRWVEFSCAKVSLADYCEVFQIIARDVTEERQKSSRLEAESLTDEMTGLSNFRSFTTRHRLEHERAVIKNQPYSVLFFDVDHFKHFNDRNGHPAGDEALRRVAAVIRDCASRSEFVARYGGEEFVVICSNAGPETATAFAEKARIAIAVSPIPFGEGQPLGKVTVSIGIASFDGSGTAAEILKRADAALYEAKKGGRNRVATSLDSPQTERKRA